MKKKVLLLVTACALLGLASCNHPATGSSSPAQSTSTSQSTSTPASSSVVASSSSSSTDSTVYATGLSVDAETVSVKIGSTHQITATVTPANVTTAGVTYSSSATDVATVSETGLITPVKLGTATITVSTKSLNAKGGAVITKTIAVTVVESDPTAITVSASAETVTAGETITLTAVVAPTTAKQTVTWSVDNTTFASIDASTGVLTGLAAGSVVVTATSTALNTVKGTKTITVEAAKPDPTGIAVTIGNSLIAINGTSQISVVFTPADAKNGVSYVSSDETIATVSATGLVTGIAAGKATITVTSTVVSTLTKSIAIEVAEAKTCPAKNICVDMSQTVETTLTGVYALTSYDNANEYGFIGATDKGIVYVYDRGSVHYTMGVVAGKYYDLIGIASLYAGTYEFIPGTSDTTKTPCVENTTVAKSIWSFENSMVLDFSNIADVTAKLQALVGKTDAEVGAKMTAVSIKNVYIPAWSQNDYSYFQAVQGTTFECPTAENNAHTIRLGIFSKFMPDGWTSASQLADYQGFFYSTNYAFSAGASAANISCRFAGGTITSVK